jgi:hypothetical protein
LLLSILHLALRLGQHPQIVFGVLLKVLGRNAVVRQLRISCELIVLVDDLLGRSTNLSLGPRGIEDAVHDVAHRTVAVTLGPRT